jgi:hypothetical protein
MERILLSSVPSQGLIPIFLFGGQGNPSAFIIISLFMDAPLHSQALSALYRFSLLIFIGFSGTFKLLIMDNFRNLAEQKIN